MLVEEASRAHQALGSVKYQTSDIEEKSKKHRRSIYFVKDMKAGDMITEDCLRCIRPGFGAPPKYWDKLINSPIKEDVSLGTPVSLNLILE